MRIAIGSDRRGFEYKSQVIEYLKNLGHEVVDVGPDNDRFPVDYPIYGMRVGKLVSTNRCNRGIVICATGIGIMIACNKIPGIRCGMGYNDEVCRLMREHNDANVIAFGQNQMSIEEIKKRLSIFLNSEYLSGYHDSRIQQIRDIENGKDINQTPYIDY